MNLLKETIEIIISNGKSVKNVVWVGNRKRKIAWEKFSAIADIEYDEGFGGSEIAADLIIAGEDWWLERGEYDGSEWWEFKTMPIEPTGEDNLYITEREKDEHRTN